MFSALFGFCIFISDSWCHFEKMLTTSGRYNLKIAYVEEFSVKSLYISYLKPQFNSGRRCRIDI